MVIFNSYVKLPEGSCQSTLTAEKTQASISCHCNLVGWVLRRNVVKASACPPIIKHGWLENAITKMEVKMEFGSWENYHKGNFPANHVG
jgi:NADH:ubiquinone oxidoreductase subunit